jgi:hypothetical protein
MEWIFGSDLYLRKEASIENIASYPSIGAMKTAKVGTFISSSCRDKSQAYNRRKHGEAGPPTVPKNNEWGAKCGVLATSTPSPMAEWQLGLAARTERALGGR